MSLDKKKEALRVLLGHEIHDMSPLQERRLFQDLVFVTAEGEETEEVQIWDLQFGVEEFSRVTGDDVPTIRGKEKRRGVIFEVNSVDTEYANAPPILHLPVEGDDGFYWLPSFVKLEY